MLRFLFCLPIILFTLLYNDASAQFLVQGGGLNQDEALDIASDAAGNSYVTGYFGSTLTFAGGVSVSSSGLSDIFLLKANSAGQVLWAVKAGGTSDERGTSVSVDNAGNVYITGYFQGTTNFSGTPITSVGLQDIFVAKYNSAGALQWVRRAGGTGADLGSGIAADNAGNVVVTGEFKNTADFGAINLTAGGSDAFVAKYDATGAVVWAKNGAGPDNSRGLDVTCDATGNIYATGQFTNDITFDVLQTNNIFNAIYLVKFNAAGNEQWFRKIGGAVSNIAYSLEVDATANVYITGDFTGNLVFFPNTATPLTDPNPNRIFLAKYNTGGTFQWARADGSVNEVSSRRVTVGSGGEAYIGGWFKCTMTEYSAQYGEGTFNSVGFKDGFVARYDATGNRTWARNFGGRQDDYVTGLAPGPNNMPLVSAVYSQNLFVPAVPGYSFDANDFEAPFVMGTSPYCSDNNYNSYLETESTGGSDFAFGNLINPTREPLDYYLRQTGGCNRDDIKVCIDYPLMANCPDTMTFCGPGTLWAQSNTNGVDPEFTYLWSTGGTDTITTANATGNYRLTQTSLDGCYVTSDTVYVKINPPPAKPPITDDVVINNHSLNPTQIKLCAPDSVQLTGSPQGATGYQWSGPMGTFPPQDSVITVSQIGLHDMVFTTTTANGCTVFNHVLVNIQPPLPPLDPHLFCFSDPDMNDTVSFCEGGYLQYGFYDSTAGAYISCDLFTMDGVVSVNGQAPSSPVFCSDLGLALYSLHVDTAGWYTIAVALRQYNLCDTVEYTLLDSIYVNLYPLPNANITLTGPHYICPNDTIFIHAVGTPGYVWSGDIAFFVDSNTVAVTGPGTVQAAITVTDPVTGCMSNVVINHDVAVIPQPVIASNPASGLICPNDSIILSITNPQYFASFEWIGPQGTAGTGASIFVNEPGFYSCIAVDSAGCAQQSNSVEVIQYGTPYIVAGPSTFLCPPPDSVVVVVVASIGSSVVWNSPLSGTDSVQVITAPGTYSAQVTSCGVTTVATIEITQSPLNANITSTSALTFCDGDSVLLHANGTAAISYQWNPSGPTGPDYTVFASGTYTVTVQDTSGCSFESQPVVVSVTPDNIPPPEVKDTMYCPPASVQLTASSQGLVYWFANSSGGAPLDSGSVFQTPQITDAVTYYVQDAYGGCKSAIVPISLGLANCETITVPTVFTPNGDGTNDFITFSMTGAKCFNVLILNRWGVKVFESETEGVQWYGTYLNTSRPLVDGVYFFVIDYCPFDGGGKKTEKGFITLLK